MQWEGSTPAPGVVAGALASHIWTASTSSPFSDYDGAPASRRGRRPDTPGAGVVPNSNCMVTA
jgi:hypothetical protein